MVAAHNRWRQTVGTPAVKWSARLATTAQAYANKLKATQGCKQVHSDAAGLGENLFWASAAIKTSTSSTGSKTITNKAQAITPTQATDAWGSEVRNYSSTTNLCATGRVCGHYTQVVWRATTDIGCGQAVCPDNSQIWVCNYTPQGNYVGQRPY